MKSAFSKRALPLIAFTALALASLPATAGIYDSLVVFGDSLSDSGNAAAAGFIDSTQVISGNTYIPKAAYASTTFSNGPVWASDAAAPARHFVVQPALTSGRNSYRAFSGATTGGTGASPSLLDQASLYLAHNAASANALYVIEGGGKRRGSRSRMTRAARLLARR